MRTSSSTRPSRRAAAIRLQSLRQWQVSFAEVLFFRFAHEDKKQHAVEEANQNPLVSSDIFLCSRFSAVGSQQRPPHRTTCNQRNGRGGAWRVGEIHEGRKKCRLFVDLVFACVSAVGLGRSLACCWNYTVDLQRTSTATKTTTTTTSAKSKVTRTTVSDSCQ